MTPSARCNCNSGNHSVFHYAQYGRTPGLIDVHAGSGSCDIIAPKSGNRILHPGAPLSQI